MTDNSDTCSTSDVHGVSAIRDFGGLMSRLDTSGRVTVKPGVNVFTGLAAISATAMLVAAVLAVMQYLQLQK